ncbi:MAG: HD domain-containing protein [Treponemataceae bacterium]|nr:HD domain-containing protein [Treponemataceae bacterium]
MDSQCIINDLQTLFDGDSTGHGVEHSLRVWRTAMRIAEQEHCNKDVVMLSSLLHDADDYKLFQTENYANARAIMCRHGVPQVVQEEVITAIDSVSFSKNKERKPATIEGCIVQDADRLDAMGAVGIARTFAYGGKKGRSLDESLSHFEEKLFLLNDLLNTESARKIAEQRDRLLHEFYEEFLAECRGER